MKKVEGQNLTDQRFGKLVAIQKIGRNKDYRDIWLCKCDCGKEKNVLARCLLRKVGATRSCGCLQKELVANRHKLKHNLLGKKFGRLLVVSRANAPIHWKKKKNYWLCKCYCGKETIIDTERLNSGQTKSCGCLWMEKCNGIPYTERNPDIDIFRPILANIDKRSGIFINITLTDLKFQWDRQKGVCPYSGLQLKIPDWKTPRRHPQVASLDRIDSSKGYTQDNIQFVSLMANLAKNEMPHEQMIYFCKSIAKFWRDRC